MSEPVVEMDINCVHGRLGRLLGRAVPEGVMLMCREHRAAHLITWERLDEMRQELQLQANGEARMAAEIKVMRGHIGGAAGVKEQGKHETAYDY